MKLRHLSIAALISVSALSAQTFIDKLNTDFLTDTVTINTDSLSLKLMGVHFLDNRPNKGKTFSISQGKKRDTMTFPDSTFKLKVIKRFNRFVYKYVPIDIVYELDKPLAELINTQSGTNGDSSKNTLVLNHFEFWYDMGRSDGHRVLNGQTQLKSPSGELLNEWQWDVSEKRKKGEKLESLSGRVLEKWVQDQNEALKLKKQNPISPFPYKRFVLGRLDYGHFPDGYRVDWHVSLNYPNDHLQSYETGLPSFTVSYQRMDGYSLLSIMQSAKQRFKRINPSFITRLSFGYGIGIMNYKEDQFDNLKVEHIYNINVFAAYNIEYRPQFHKGIFWGVGAFVDVNPWPDIISISKSGVLLSVGMMLP